MSPVRDRAHLAFLPPMVPLSRGPLALAVLTGTHVWTAGSVRRARHHPEDGEEL